MKAFGDFCPGVIGNKYIPHWPLPAQAVFMSMHRSAAARKGHRLFECLYGGAAGGGKSDVLLMAAAQFVHIPSYSGILFRKTHTDLMQPGALLDRALSWWKRHPDVHWDGTNKIFTFPSGARLAFAYLKNPLDHFRYASAEYQYTAWDELTQWETLQPYEFVGYSRVRKPVDSPVPLRTLSASNPGGPGHTAVLEKFIGDPEQGIIPTAPYIPARIDDNPYIDREAYIDSLQRLDPTTRDRLLKGDWRAREPGDYFRAEWFGALLDPDTQLWKPRDCVRVRWWDLAASERPDAAFTSGVRMARHRMGVRAVEHCVSFRATPGKRDDLIEQTAQTDGPTVVIGIEIEGGSGGIAQYAALAKRLQAKGFRVTGARPTTIDMGKTTAVENRYVMRNPISESAKATRAAPVASCLERGYRLRGEGGASTHPDFGKEADLIPELQTDGLRLFNGPWTRRYLDVVENFPDGATCDEVDATSGAWAYLEAHPLGGSTPIVQKSPHEAVDQQNVHPAFRRTQHADPTHLPRRNRLWTP